MSTLNEYCIVISHYIITLLHYFIILVLLQDCHFNTTQTTFWSSILQNTINTTKFNPTMLEIPLHTTNTNNTTCGQLQNPPQRKQMHPRLPFPPHPDLKPPTQAESWEEPAKPGKPCTMRDSNCQWHPLGQTAPVGGGPQWGCWCRGASGAQSGCRCSGHAQVRCSTSAHRLSLI